MGGEADRARSIAAVILAAGASTRYGQPKQLLHHEGRSLLRRAAEAVAGSGCRPIVVVLGAFATSCANELRGLPVHLTENTAWREGMGSSIRTGIEAVSALAPGAIGVVVTLCDQPLVSAQIIDALAQWHRDPFPAGIVDIDTSQDYAVLQTAAASSSRAPGLSRGSPCGGDEPAVPGERQEVHGVE